MKKLTTLFMAVLLLQSLSIFAQDAAPLPEENPLATEPAATIVDGEEEDEEKGFELTGFVDAYYQAGLTESSEAEEPIAFPTSFTDQTNQFAIGMVNLMATKEMGKVSFVGQVGFGPRAVAANSDSNDDGSFGDNFASTIQQLYVSYSPSDAVTFTLGNFGTFVGYEVIDAPANVNYSTSYLFSNGPFYHTGAKVDFAISDGFGAMIGVFNDNDSKIDAIDGKHIGGQLSFETGGLAA
ncbi:MAG: porin [Bacteroidota bacterium]